MSAPAGARPFLKAVVATAAFGVIHSALAATAAKRRAATTLGHRHRSGLYRPFYIVQSFVTVGVLAWYIRSLPRQEVYRVSGVPATLMRAGQAASLVWALLAARAVGIADISGLRNLATWITGGDPGPEPEAQGPAPSDHGMRITGPFRLTRHPLNLAPAPVFWLQPVMTTRFLGFSAAATAYLLLGSAHEERRLERAYGEPYRRYLESGVPFYLPTRGTHAIPPAREQPRRS